MSDPNQAADAARQAQEHISWWQLAAGGGAATFLMRMGLSLFRRFGIVDSRLAAEEKLRTELLAELEKARGRAAERELYYEARISALERARDERIEELQKAFFDAERRIVEVEAENRTLKADSVRTSGEVAEMTDAPPVAFSTERIRDEFSQLPRRNPLLFGILDETSEHASNALNWRLTLIDIFRTAEEEARIDAASTLGAGRRPGTRSPHAFWLAADVRTQGVPLSSVEALDRWINERWIYDPARPDMQVSDIRPHGTGPHMHLQAKPGVTRRRLP